MNKKIYTSNCGLKKLISYLSNSVDVNRPIVDIMTPNYDRVIEILCDSLEIQVINGYLGGAVGAFKSDLLKNPRAYYRMKRPPNRYIRLFKPHGSINWIRSNEQIFQIHDNKRLLEDIENIEIIAPGGAKYEEGFSNIQYVNHRDGFTQSLEEELDASLLFFGYGFNDPHFDVVTSDYFDKKKHF
ncbi:SIR2 family protein [Listeria aquatica]|uniref:Uncharacterized protein n=1 Tax=Listeria aquatica FSL S10-1188 TaxID=1265818 RepID=W7B3Q4_9LIST|nr:SIR2 family protein [Listeria aquatica]EUJ20557.1 hypothetical protein MAQA_03971 [Listeria aquatica FSL S10-1188]